MHRRWSSDKEEGGGGRSAEEEGVITESADFSGRSARMRWHDPGGMRPLHRCVRQNVSCCAVLQDSCILMEDHECMKATKKYCFDLPEGQGSAGL